MTTIVTRAGKGTPLTNTEVDTNFTNLNTAKIETLTSTDTSVTITGTGASRDLSVPVNPNVVSGPASATDNAIARFDTTTGKLVQNSVVTIDDDGNIIGADSVKFSGTPPTSITTGALWFDSTNNSLNFQQNAITQQIGEEMFVYGKASAAITEGQLICKTGVVGASGQITFGPSPANLLDNDGIIGVATENIASGSFGRITFFGVVHGIDATGTSAGQTWLDGDTLWYNPAGGGLMTNVKPVAPIVKYQIATVIHNGGSGSGSIQVNLEAGTTLGGTDNNVQLGTLAAANLLTYSTTNGYWKNTALAAGTGISVGNAASGIVTVTNSAPDQTVAFTNGTGISVTGTYPNFTVTNTAPSSGGTVTNIATGTGLTGGPITSTGTVSLANTAVTPGSYTYASITVDQQGRLTAASSGTAPASIPAGSVMLFYQAAAPTGWTQVTTAGLDDSALRIVTTTGGSTGGTTAFSTVFTNQTPTGTVGVTVNATTATMASYTPTGSISVSVGAGTLAVGAGTFAVGATTLSTAQMPSHTHPLGISGTPSCGGFLGAGNISAVQNNSGATGGGGSHTHGLTGAPSLSGAPSVTGQSFTGNAATLTQNSHTHTTTNSFTGNALTLNVKYVNIIICSKN